MTIAGMLLFGFRLMILVLGVIGGVTMLVAACNLAADGQNHLFVAGLMAASGLSGLMLALAYGLNRGGLRSRDHD